MINHTTNKEQKFINLFRALAAFWVLTSHTMIWGGWYGIPIPNPKIAVDLFMIISGYLMISQTNIRNKQEPMWFYKSWLRFWIRRFFRIAPAYYLSLFFAVILSEYFLGGYQELQMMNIDRWKNVFVYDPSRIIYDIKNIFLHITFLFGLDPQYSFSTFLPDWSLSLEMQFYFVFPFIFLMINKIGIEKSTIKIAIFSFIISWLVNKFLFFYEPSFLALKLQYFLVGIILYYLLHHNMLFKKKIILVFIAFLLLFVERKFGSLSIFILFSMMLLIGYLEISEKLSTSFLKLLDNKIVTYMSDSSYSVYLFHGFFIAASGLIISNIDILKESSLLVHTAFMWLFVVVFTYPLAYFIFQNVEKKGILYGKSLINQFLPVSDKGNNL